VGTDRTEQDAAGDAAGGTDVGTDVRAGYDAYSRAGSAAGGTDRRAAAMSDLEREISLLFRGARSLSERMAATIHPDLDAPGYGLLLTILDMDPEAEGVRAVDLAARTRLHKSTLSRSLADLEALGLLARVRDPHDARARLVTLTDRGRTAVAESRQGRREQMSVRLAEWDADDLLRLAELLGRLTRSLNVET
jgi:DNA-binding MarR family transcriptional regulator